MYTFYKTYYKLHPHFMYTQKHMHTIVQHTRACMRVSAHMPCYNSRLIPGSGRAISQQCGPTSPPPLPSMRTRVNTHAHTRILLHWYSPTTRIYVDVSILIRDTHGRGHIRGDDHSRRKLNLIQVKLILEQVGSFVRCDSRHRTWCNHEGYTTPHPLVPFSVYQNRKFFFLK